MLVARRSSSNRAKATRLRADSPIGGRRLGTQARVLIRTCISVTIRTMTLLRVQDDIIPIGEFKTHAARIMRHLRDTGRPVVITQHGRPAGVLVPPGEFDRLTERDRFLAAIRQGLMETEAGRVMSDDELGADFDRKCGPSAEP